MPQPEQSVTIDFFYHGRHDAGMSADAQQRRAATGLAALTSDLRDEGDDLDALVTGLDVGEWSRPTPSPRWTIAHQIAHLAWTDDQSILAATDPDEFADLVARTIALPNPLAAVDAAAEAGSGVPAPELLARWRAGRTALIEALVAVPDGSRIPWFGPPMSAASMATARLMETWAHGQDVADALSVTRRPTHRLRHVAHIGVRARDYAYLVRGATPPTGPFRVELTGPAGESWTWGPEDAAPRVTGTALDFCLLATQRRHRGDLDVTAVGPDADHWLDIAQTFAGPSGPGREQGQFA
jgi:uncharacterized protein (TIGR03084 family)